MKVEFGTKHLGHRYLDVWNGDQSWIVWFLKHYSQSVKTAHRLMVYYIECKIERAELEGKQVLMTVPATSSPMTSSGAHGKPLHTQAKAKASQHRCHAKRFQSSIQSSRVGRLDDVELFEDMGAQIERSQMEARMNNMENAINSILLHLEQMAQHLKHECLEHRIPVDVAAADMFGFLAAGDPSHDCDQHEGLSNHSCVERQRFWKLVNKYEQELRSMATETKLSTVSQKKLDVLEVFCGPNSQLTKQCNNLGYTAERLGYAQCDLRVKRVARCCSRACCRNGLKCLVLTSLRTMVRLVNTER